ncbi:thiol-disulfide oxidoreductase DCC family protein [Nisaea sp.]|uniref:thiol-disulfide oxidoreductase DCC family protein n=1 Tax=Nisaea sp. TaxID=2024842 RepID=UPI003B51D6A5
MKTSPKPASENREIVYFDGSCPICSREIAAYRRVRGAERIEWQDVSIIEGRQIAEDLSAGEAMSRFHLRRRDGTLVSGAEAFGHLWSALPLFRLLGRFALLPPVTFLLERLYRLFLPLRNAATKRHR